MDNETMYLLIIQEMINFFLKKRIAGEEITDAEILDAREKRKNAIDKLKA